jgi:FMN-dependent oxidoreductase (nitrilotriacetate monooxygenase family)
MSRSKNAPEMTLVAFMQAQNCSNYVGSWRHPEAMPDFMTAQYYQRIARTLEDAKFHLAFFDDRLAMPDMYRDDFGASVENGIRCVKMDLIPILTAMGMATSKLGLGGTYSTTYYEPFHVARVFATLDLMIGGRAAWNVVTSLNDSEAANFGQTQHLEHDTRYDRADEFMEVVLGHWRSWQDDAIVLDKECGRFADPAKVRRLDHKGQWFKSRGPFTVPRSPQGHPVVMQAGQSGRGSAFAARWGELIFATAPNKEVGQRNYKSFKAEVARIGRDPDKVCVAPAVNVVVGETRAIAEEKLGIIRAASRPIDQLSLISEVTNFDLGKRPFEVDLSDADVASMGGMRALVDRVINASGKKNPSPADFVKFSKHGAYDGGNLFTGTPKDVADQMEAWYLGEACDGFVVTAAYVPGSYEDFARLVVPELQRRGLFRRDYRGNTLRSNLGLDIPAGA